MVNSTDGDANWRSPFSANGKWRPDHRKTPFFEAGFVKGPIHGKEKNHRNELETYGVFFTVQKLYNNLQASPGMIHPPSKWELRELKKHGNSFGKYHRKSGFLSPSTMSSKGQGQWGVSVAEIQVYYKGGP